MARHMHPWWTGKNLFDVLSQTPNFGVGRLVTRTRWQYLHPSESEPSPSYYRITRVKVDCTKPELNDGEAWGIATRKGYSRNIESKIGATWKQEWKLIRKSDEEQFCAFMPKEDDFHEVPTHTEVPPLLAEIMRRDKASRGETVDYDEPVLMKLNISNSYKSRGYQRGDRITVADHTVETDV